MRGECNGKVRSTPTPYEMRRTVNEARPPSPRRRITMPSKTCNRSFSPSTTLTCTRTVSPGANPARSFLSCAASTSRIASITHSPFLETLIDSPRPAGPQPRDSLRLALPLRSRVVELLRRFPAFESLHQLALVGRQPRRRQEVRTFAPREPDRLHTAPARDARVV